MSERNDGESFADYQIRRKADRATLDAHLSGAVVTKGSETNRKDNRARQFKSKHFGSHDKYAQKR